MAQTDRQTDKQTNIATERSVKKTPSRRQALFCQELMIKVYPGPVVDFNVLHITTSLYYI